MVKIFNNMKALLFLTLLCAVIISACNKVAVVTPTFDVSAPKTIYKVGDTVKFNFTGSADNITFYSGEIGKNYYNKDRLSIPGSIPTLSFSTSLQTGNQTNNLAVLVSTDFNGQFDAADIKAATWTDITAQAKLATSATVLASGAIDLSSFKTAGQNAYVAFKYTSLTNTTTSISRGWTISVFSYKNVFPDGSQYIIATDFTTGGFSAVSVLNAALKWSVGSTTMVFPAGTVGSIDEDWTISRPFQFDQSAPDVGVGVKNISSALSSPYTYNYAAAGTYKAVFVASNRVGDNSQQSVKTINITIIP
jgi:hypothetical protein